VAFAGAVLASPVSGSCKAASSEDTAHSLQLQLDNAVAASAAADSQSETGSTAAPVARRHMSHIQRSPKSNRTSQ